MFNFKKRFSLLLCLSALGIEFTNVSFAQLEVVKAKTVRNDNEITQVKDDEYFDSFDVRSGLEGYDFDDGDNKNTLSDVIINKTRKFFRHKDSSEKEDGIVEETNNETSDAVSINDDENIKQVKNSVPKTEDKNLDEEDVYKQANYPKNPHAGKYYVKEEQIDNADKYQINADEITYDDTEGNVYAKGNVEIISKEKNTVLKADNALLDKENQLLKLTGDVKIIKGTSEMLGESLVVDLNEENILMDNPTLNGYQFTVKAQEGFLIANDIQMLNGTLKSSRKDVIPLESRAFQRYENVAVDYLRDRNKLRDVTDDNTKHKYRIDAKEVVVTSYKDHNSVVLKGSNVFYNNHKVIRNTDIEIISDRKIDVVETNATEAGSLRGFGAYLGYGHVFKLPKGQTLKLIPSLVYGDDELGLGLIGRHRTPNSQLEAGYASSSTDLILRGKYKLGHGLTFRYGRHAYIPEGFLGARRSGYAAQFQYVRSYLIRDLGARFNNAIYAGLFKDYAKKHQDDAFCTTRLRYIAELRKTFFRYANEEQDLSIQISAMAQGAATVYGSGETAAIGRIGPTLTTKLKRWESSLGYMIAGVHEETPFNFDRYRYGKSSIMLNQKFNLNRKLSVGFRANVSPLKDNYKGDLLTESRFYVIAGPEDLKLCASYDFVRDIAHLDFLFLIGPENSSINFEKLVTKNIDGNQDKVDFYKYKPVKIDVPENI